MSRIFPSIVFGPVYSRRFGASLGINLMPADVKVCSFDCVYCECGFNEKNKGKMPNRETVCEELEHKLAHLFKLGQTVDVITFSGNGEPTLYPEFEEIINDTLKARDKYFPKAKVTVLSNSTCIQKPSVFRALQKVDNNVLKFDSAINETMLAIDQPNAPSFTVQWLVEHLKAFNSKLTIQTIFIRGSHKGKAFDNTTDLEVNAWLHALQQIQPKQVMIYALDRPAPVSSLEKVSLTELDRIADKARKLGFDVVVAG